MYKWIWQSLLSFSMSCAFVGTSSVSFIAKATNPVIRDRAAIWDRDLAECKANRRPTEYPAKESREIRIERHNISFKIPNNYRTRSKFSNDSSYIGVHEPSEFNYWECLKRKQVPAEGEPTPLIVEIERTKGEKSLVEIINRRYKSHNGYRENSMEQISKFRADIGIQKALKFQYISHYHSQNYQSLLFFLPGNKNFVIISHAIQNDNIEWGKIFAETVMSLKLIRDSSNAQLNLNPPPKPPEKPSKTQQNSPSAKPRYISINSAASTISQRPSIQEIALINQQTGSQQSPPQLNQIQRQARQTLQQQTSKYLSPFVGSWRTTDNQTIFIYPSTRKGKERQACIIIEKDNTQDLQIGVATGNATGTDINIGRSRLFNIKQPNTLALRNPGSNQLVAVYAAPESPSLTENNRSSMEDNGCITSFPSTAIAIDPRNSSFQPRKTFPNIKAFGLDQFIQSNQTLAKVSSDLEKAKQGQYTIPKLPKLDLLTEPLTDIPEEAGKFLGSRKQITLEDYLTLKLKVNQQGLLLRRTAESLGTAEKYLEQFPKDGQDQHPVVTSISSRFWKAVEQDGGSKWGLGDRLVYALEESRVATGGFIQETTKTGLTAFAAWRDLEGWIDLLPKDSTQRRALGLAAELWSNQKYLNSVNSSLPEILKFVQSGDSEKAIKKLADLQIATLEWLDEIQAKDKPQEIKRGKLLLEIRKGALEIKEAVDLLSASSTKEVLSDFDRAYLITAAFNSFADMSLKAISLMASDESRTSAFLKKGSAVKIIVMDSIKFTYKDEIRRQYQALQSQEKTNQKIIDGLSTAFDLSGEEIGKYLLRNRTDVLRQTRTGGIEVSIKETVYPRK